MIGFVKGKVEHLGKNYVIVGIGAIGYKIYSLESYKKGEAVQVFTYQYVKEDALDLYGFKKITDLETFELMLSVNGVGPKMAMNLVVNLGKEKIIAAISNADTSAFRTVSGVGQKLAGKIIVELKNKIAKGDLPGSFFEGGDEVVEALKTFGLERGEVMGILRDLPKNISSTEDKIKFVLKNVKKKR